MVPSRDHNRLVLLTALGWAAGLFLAPSLIGLAVYGIERGLDIQFVPDFGGAMCNLFLGPAAGGAIGGYFTASLLRRFPALAAIRTRNIVLIWAAALLLAVIFSLFLNGFLAELSQPIPVGGTEGSL